MLIAKVVGNVVSTRKNENLVGSKFAIVQTIPSMGGKKYVAVDQISAGIGEYVLLATGSAARIGSEKENAPIDIAIVGIVDEDCNDL